MWGREDYKVSLTSYKSNLLFNMNLRGIAPIRLPARGEMCYIEGCVYIRVAEYIRAYVERAYNGQSGGVYTCLR